MSRLLYCVWCNPGDPASNDLIECNGLAKCSGGQNTNLGYDIMPLHIIGRVFLKVGTARFELATPSTPLKCATWLRYVPNYFLTLQKNRLDSF